jgi:hypothetical protein
MSRPVRFVLPGLALAAALAFSSCVGTIYDRTYSYQRNYFKPPKEKHEAAEDTAVLGALSTPSPAGDAAVGAAGLPAPADVPGLAAPPGLPDAGAAGAPPATPPAAPAAPPAPPK